MGTAAQREPGFQVLYTSLERDVALAEVASYLALLQPMPSKPLVVHKIVFTTRRTITLTMSGLEMLGVDPSRYGDRNYAETQIIGTAINYLGLDGLVSPSARWDCDNLTLFMANRALGEKLQVVASEEVDWREWTERARIIEPH